jgi:hypothetical protein
MAQSISYRIGVLTRRHPLGAAVVLVLVGLLAWAALRSASPLQPAAVKPPLTTAKPAPVVDEFCSAGLDALVAKAKALTAKGQAVAAYDVLYPCRDQLLVSSEKAYYTKALAAYDEASSAALRKAEADRTALKKSLGVGLGMSREDALASSWGKPNHVNRTVSINGIQEQWVYKRGYNPAFLYFDGDVLVNIQN